MTHVADETEYQRRLGEKLLEESQEFVVASGYESGGVGEHAGNSGTGSNNRDGESRDCNGLADEPLEELADVLEVIDAICALEGISRDRLEEVQREKRDRRGGFRERVVLEQIEEVDEGVPEPRNSVDEP